jgi:hypothetical protein
MHAVVLPAMVNRKHVHLPGFVVHDIGHYMAFVVRQVQAGTNVVSALESVRQPVQAVAKHHQAIRILGGNLSARLLRQILEQRVDLAARQLPY